MAKTQKGIFFWVILFLMINGTFYAALADDDGHKQKSWYQKVFDWDDDDDDHDGEENRKRYQKRSRNGFKHHEKRDFTSPRIPTYTEQCGGCHFAYQPELLPSGSWEKILAQLDDHFGDYVDIEQDAKKVIGEYLKTNAADRSSAKRAVKIMQSLRDQTPLRITEVPYIKGKHHELSQDVFKRESIGSLANCSACHTSAEEGVYDDDNVVIPR